MRLTFCSVAAIWAFSFLTPAQQRQIPRFGASVTIPDGFRGRVYLIPPATTALPDFKHLTPVGTIYTWSLDIPPQDFHTGFPGITDRYEWFAIDYTGSFWVQKTGHYHFALFSDDGAKLYIDDRLIADNDGLHPPQVRLAKCKLRKGLHWMRVSYFQGPRYQLALVLSVARPGEKHFKVFDMKNFEPPAASAVP